MEDTAKRQGRFWRLVAIFIFAGAMILSLLALVLASLGA
jgi:hypothetical protein